MSRTKADLIRAQIKKRLPVSQIALLAKTSQGYVYQVIWRDQRRGYHAKWMKRKRASDPAYYARELAQQAERKARERAHG